MSSTSMILQSGMQTSNSHMPTAGPFANNSNISGSNSGSLGANLLMGFPQQQQQQQLHRHHIHQHHHQGSYLQNNSNASAPFLSAPALISANGGEPPSIESYFALNLNGPGNLPASSATAAVAAAAASARQHGRPHPHQSLTPSLYGPAHMDSNRSSSFMSGSHHHNHSHYHHQRTAVPASPSPSVFMNMNTMNQANVAAAVAVAAAAAAASNVPSVGGQAERSVGKQGLLGPTVMQGRSSSGDNGGSANSTSNNSIPLEMQLMQSMLSPLYMQTGLRPSVVGAMSMNESPKALLANDVFDMPEDGGDIHMMDGDDNDDGADGSSRGDASVRSRRSDSIDLTSLATMPNNGNNSSNYYTSGQHIMDPGAQAVIGSGGVDITESPPLASIGDGNNSNGNSSAASKTGVYSQMAAALMSRRGRQQQQQQQQQQAQTSYNP
ncbi:hypothetical protein GGH99_008417, partial [Coemansia sp. RSA 1285]